MANRDLPLMPLLGALLCMATASAAQVPVLDPARRAELLEVYAHLERDTDSQVEKANNRAAIRDFEQQQIASLDALIEAFNDVPTFHSTYMQGEGSEFSSVEVVYGPLNNPAGGVMFGDARESVEQLIIRGSQATYSHPGVQKAGLSPLQWRCLVQAMIWQESRFNPGAESHVGAYGLTQIMPATAGDLGVYPQYRSDPYLQVEAGSRYLAQRLNYHNGNIIHALAAYNAGSGNVDKYGGVPPFEETQHYVQVIPARYNQYLNTIGGVEALGTIDPAEYAVANASLMSFGSMHYANNSMATAQQALLRVRALVQQIEHTETVAEAYNLNTMIRAEVIFILAQRQRLKAARTQSEYAQIAARLTAQREAMRFAVHDTVEF